MLFLLALLFWQAAPAAPPQTLAKQSAEARSALLSGDSTSAIRIYKHLISALPDDPRMRLNYALALEAGGKYLEELTQLRVITRTHPELTPAWLLTGLALEKLGQPAEAIEPLKAVLAREADNVTAQFELADAYLSSGHFQEATELFTALAARDTRSAKALQGLALSSAARAKSLDEQRGSPAELATARQIAEVALSKLRGLPDSASLHETLASIQAERGLRNEAIEEWRKAVALAPDDLRLKGRLASSLAASRFYEEAIAILIPMVQAHPDAMEWQFTLGDSLFREKQTEEAIPHLEAARKLNPEFLPARASLGRAYLESGKPGLAIPHLKAAVSTDEEALLFQLAQAYRATGQTGLANQAVEQQKAAAAKQSANQTPLRR